MRVLVLAVVLGLATSSANAFWGTKKKKATDAEGNCVGELITENARLYGELEVMDKITTRAEAQLKSTVKESQKLGFDGLKELSAKAKATRAAIKKFSDTFGDATCKAQVSKGGKPQIITMQVKANVAELDKLSSTYEKIADDFLKKNLAGK